MPIGGTDLFVVRRTVASPCITHRLLGKQDLCNADYIIISLHFFVYHDTFRSTICWSQKKKKMQVPKKAVHKTMMHEYVLLEGLRSYDGATTRGSVCHGSDCLECSQEMNCVLTFSRLARLSRLWEIHTHTHTHSHRLYTVPLLCWYGRLCHQPPQSEFLLFHKQIKSTHDLWAMRVGDVLACFCVYGYTQLWVHRKHHQKECKFTPRKQSKSWEGRRRHRNVDWNNNLLLFSTGFTLKSGSVFSSLTFHARKSQLKKNIIFSFRIYKAAFALDFKWHALRGKKTFLESFSLVSLTTGRGTV